MEIVTITVQIIIYPNFDVFISASQALDWEQGSEDS